MEYQGRLKVLLTLLILLFMFFLVMFFLFINRRDSLIVGFEQPSSNFVGNISQHSPVAPPVVEPIDNPPLVVIETVVEPITPTITTPTSSTATRMVSLGRSITSQHRVVTGDTVSNIAFARWGNAFLWPDLYVNNEWLTDDPDLIFPGEVVDIFNRLGPNGRFSQDEIVAINEAYITVYNLYAALGTRREASRMWVLYSASRVIPNFLDINASRINSNDLIQARRQLEESRALR
jgi:hypothetical protein